MYKFHKHNRKTGIKKDLQSSQVQYSPFTFGDTAYLDRIKGELTRPNLPRFQH